MGLRNVANKLTVAGLWPAFKPRTSSLRNTAKCGSESPLINFLADVALWISTKFSAGVAKWWSITVISPVGCTFVCRLTWVIYPTVHLLLGYANALSCRTDVLCRPALPVFLMSCGYICLMQGADRLCPVFLPFPMMACTQHLSEIRFNISFHFLLSKRPANLNLVWSCLLMVCNIMAIMRKFINLCLC